MSELENNKAIIFNSPLIFKIDEQVKLGAFRTPKPVTDFETHRVYVFHRLLSLIERTGIEDALTLVDNYFDIPVHDGVDPLSLAEVIMESMQMEALLIDIQGNYDNTTPEGLANDFYDALEQSRQPNPQRATQLPSDNDMTTTTEEESILDEMGLQEYLELLSQYIDE